MRRCANTYVVRVGGVPGSAVAENEMPTLGERGPGKPITLQIWGTDMLTMYVYDTVKMLEELLGSARNLQTRFDRGDSAEDLLVDAKSLRDRLLHVIDNLPESGMDGDCKRHLGWLVSRLAEDKISSCRSDIDDLVNGDIPSVVSVLQKWARNADYLDKTLRAAVAPLVRNRQFDSAIRKSFVLLTERLRETYGLQSNTDGEDLVNKVFGGDSAFHTSLDRSEKLAHRNLFSGMYGVVRNKFSHNSREATLAEMQAAVSMVNLCLLTIEELRNVE